LDTIGQKVGPLSKVDRYGTPFSAALHLIERYRLIDGTMARDLQQKHESVYFGAGRSSPPANPYGRGEIDTDPTKPGLLVEIAVDDPATFATPWSALVTYRRVQGTWPEAVCAKNTRGSGSSWVSLVASGLEARLLKVGPRLLRSAVAVWDHGGPDRTHGEGPEMS
jgi:hypothetical protein